MDCVMKCHVFCLNNIFSMSFAKKMKTHNLVGMTDAVHTRIIIGLRKGKFPKKTKG